MKMLGMVLEERAESYTSKSTGKEVKMTVLTILDMETETGCRLLTTADYSMSEEEIAKYSGKVSGKNVLFGLREMRVLNGGRYGFRGRILAVDPSK